MVKVHFWGGTFSWLRRVWEIEKDKLFLYLILIPPSSLYDIYVCVSNYILFCCFHSSFKLPHLSHLFHISHLSFQFFSFPFFELSWDSHFKKQFGTGKGMLSSLFYWKTFFSFLYLIAESSCVHENEIAHTQERKKRHTRNYCDMITECDV